MKIKSDPDFKQSGKTIRASDIDALLGINESKDLTDRFNHIANEILKTNQEISKTKLQSKHQVTGVETKIMITSAKPESKIESNKFSIAENKAKESELKTAGNLETLSTTTNKMESKTENKDEPK